MEPRVEKDALATNLTPRPRVIPDRARLKLRFGLASLTTIIIIR